MQSETTGAVTTATMGPFLRWAGSKKKLLPVLESYWNEGFDRYVEPFAGSACLFFRLDPEKALLADKNADLINVYSAVAANPETFYKKLQAIPRNPDTYYQIRSMKLNGLSEFDRAINFVYLNRNCFNGIYRTNSKGVFNVPYGGERAGNMPSLESFLASAERLGKARLRNWDFGTTIRHTRKGDFVYMDPPYAVESRRVFKEYGGKPFSKSDLSRLDLHLNSMENKGVKFVVSYADCRESREIGSRWKSKGVYVRRNVAGFAGARKKAREIIITNIE